MKKPKPKRKQQAVWLIESDASAMPVPFEDPCLIRGDAEERAAWMNAKYSDGPYRAVKYIRAGRQS